MVKQPPAIIHTGDFGKNTYKTTQFYSNMGIDLVENSEVGLDMHL